MIGNSRWVNCRWCGSDWTRLQAVPRMDDDPEMLAVLCTTCGASGPDGKGRKGAVRKWNKGPLAWPNKPKTLTCPKCGGDYMNYLPTDLATKGSKVILPIWCHKCETKVDLVISHRKGKVYLQGRYA